MDFNKIKLFMDASGAEWRCVNYGDVSRLIFALPYEQLKIDSGDMAFIDGYYTASNRAYHLRKRLAELLEDEGVTTAEVTIPYKLLAANAGLGIALKSTLIANEKFGTRMALEAIEFDGGCGSSPLDPVLADFCSKCGLCEKSCPNGAIGSTFDYTRCLRNHQNSGFIEDESVAAAMGNRVMGCDVCQSVCPLNRRLPVNLPDESRESMLGLESIFNACMDGKKALEPYREMLGGNYLRPARLLALVINAMTNSDTPEKYSQQVKAALNHSDGRVRAAAERFFEKLQKS